MSTQAIGSCDCGYTSPPTTPGMAAYALRKHSCTTYQERIDRAQRRLDRLALSGPEQPCLHKQARHIHGTYACYVLDRCRCRPCRDANNAYTAATHRAQNYGRWDNLVDAAPARAHIRALMAQGMGLKRIVAVSDISQGMLWKLLYGKRRHGRKNGRRTPSVRITKSAQARILAISLDLAGGAKTPGIGSRRRLQALVANGWSMSKLAGKLGFLPSNFMSVIHDGPGALTVSTVKAVQVLYDQLWDAAPPRDTHRDKIAYSRARRYAANPEARSIRYSLEPAWAGPLAWDDDTIDDPDAEPNLGDLVKAVGRARTVDVETIEWLLDQEPFTVEQMATRLGVVRSTVEHFCARHDRRDLLARMARNKTVQENAA